ncbi:hypothetical protein FVEG_05831 [Fusarium verticillioides 7600]|uniref:Uncharacterized protein n=1 Tax=Gibberella moniliformis (strain M3125 / FGSC 7600) TaxID=334819 RepID=W7MB87_GIBM7|nr:hypothetical protein FVEG_05831 [Fusarium verticillioides 7600]EWG44860.1 hypothetical protein FVEG_05831 [Fusarium verticillioides 7600]
MIDSRLPSSGRDKQILVQLKSDEHSDTWDEETKRELVDHILKGYTKTTKSNQIYPSCHRLWQANNPTFARWVVLRVTYDEDKLSTPREWLRHQYENFDPQSWASPVSKKPLKAQGTRCESEPFSEDDLGTLWKSQESKSLRSAESMEICDNESDYDKTHGDGTYKYDRHDNSDQDETNDKAITRSRFRAVNVPEPGRDLSRKRGTSNASVYLCTKLQKTDSLRTPSSTEEAHLPKASGQSTAQTADIQARPRPLQWRANLQELRIPVRGPHQSQPALNLDASAGGQAYLSPNPTVVSFTQSFYDQNDFRTSTTPRQWARSQERSSCLNTPVVSHEKKADDQSVPSDPRDHIQNRGHSTQSGHVRANFGLVDPCAGESAASTQSLPRSPKCRDNIPTIVPHGSSNSFVFPSSSYGEARPHTREPLPLRVNHRETLETPGNVFTQQPSGLQQLPPDDPGEPSWFRRFRTQYYSDQKETRARIAYEIKREVTGIVFKAVRDLIQPLSNSITQCVDTLAKHNTNAVGVTKHIYQAVSAAQDLGDMKQILNNTVETSSLQLETFQREGAAIQGQLLPVITEYRKDIDNLAQRATSIEERTIDVEEYLELQLADKGRHPARNAPQGNESEHHTFGNHEGTGGY